MIDLEEIADSANRIRRFEVHAIGTDHSHSLIELSKIIERIAWAQAEIQKDLAWIKRKLNNEI